VKGEVLNLIMALLVGFRYRIVQHKKPHSSRACEFGVRFKELLEKFLKVGMHVGVRRSLRHGRSLLGCFFEAVKTVVAVILCFAVNLEFKIKLY
jgi:hypothetical protein